jgi:hypothetical protein
MSLTIPTKTDNGLCGQSNREQSSRLFPNTFVVPKTPQIIGTALEAQNSKPEILLFAASPKKATKRKGFSDKNEDEDEGTESVAAHTRSKKPKLFVLNTPSHSRRPKLYPGLTPWGVYGMVRELNDLYPTHELDWDGRDVPDLDLGEPLDETNFWEGPWIKANEERKRVRDERERKRKRQQIYGSLNATGRKRAYKKRAGIVTRENGRFAKLEEDCG